MNCKTLFKYVTVKYFVLILGLFLLISCSESKENKMYESIKTEFIKIMDDTSSYKFFNMKISKSISVGERKKVMNAQRLKELIDLRKNFAEIGMDTDDIIASEKQLKIEMDFLKKKDDADEAVYYVDFVVQSSNKIDPIIKKEYSATVLNDEQLTVVHLKSMN